MRVRYLVGYWDLVGNVVKVGVQVSGTAVLGAAVGWVGLLVVGVAVGIAVGATVVAVVVKTTPPTLVGAEVG